METRIAGLLGSLVLFLGVSAQAQGFPESYTPEPSWPSWPFARVEGRDASYLAEHFAEYSYKFAQKKFTAPKEEIDFFEAQRVLQQSLRTLPFPTEGVSSIAFVGDIMWIGKSWDSFISPGLLSHLNAHDFVFGNLESPIAQSRPVSRPSPVRFQFNSPPELVTTFRRETSENTFSALSVINNHALDQGEEGLTETIRFLRSQGIPFSGARESLPENPYTVVERNGFKIGFYAAGFGVNNRRDKKTTALLNILPGLAPDDALAVEIDLARDVLKRMADDGVDLKIVSLHWGFEFEYYPHPHQMRVARELIRAGADILMGHHPHVQQPDEICFVNGEEKTLPDLIQQQVRNSGCLLEDGTQRSRRALVMYSLGNFLTAMDSFLCRIGLVKTIKIARDEAGRVQWSLPQNEFAVNVGDAPPNRSHLLLRWDDYLGQRCLQTECREKDLADFARVKALQ